MNALYKPVEGFFMPILTTHQSMGYYGLCQKIPIIFENVVNSRFCLHSIIRAFTESVKLDRKKKALDV